MSACCGSGVFSSIATQQFDERRATTELARYRRQGPGPTTRRLLDGLRRVDDDVETLLDIGGGIGAIAHTLLETSRATATVVDASEPYLRIAREEAVRRGTLARTAFRHGDFLDLAPELPAASVVTMDRVVCCYPEYRPLIEAALEHARTIFAFSYPKDRWYVHLGVAGENCVRRMRHNSFRTFVHPPTALHAIVVRHGFRMVSRSETLAWSAEVWRRHAAPAAG